MIGYRFSTSYQFWFLSFIFLVYQFSFYFSAACSLPEMPLYARHFYCSPTSRVLTRHFCWHHVHEYIAVCILMNLEYLICNTHPHLHLQSVRVMLCSGVVVYWSCGVLVLQGTGRVVYWCCRALALWYTGHVVY